MSSPPVGPSEPHLLVVDDRVEELRLLIELLRRTRFRLTVAFNGTQAYQRALATCPDLILMDVRMPDMDGFAACRLLQSDPATNGIPIIFLTSANDLDERLEGLNNGAVDYIIKPFEPEEVLARIRINLKRPARAPAEAPAPPPALDRDEVLVNAARGYLAGHLDRPPNLATLARYVGTNEKRLSRAFRERIGKTVFEFIRDERLQLARRLLTETSLTITAIADELGFSSAANFATAFREHVGQTPTAFREGVRRSSRAEP